MAVDEERRRLEEAEDAAEDLRVSRLLSDRRQLVSVLLVFVLAIAAIYFFVPKLAGLGDNVKRIGDATWYWVVVAVGFNILAFAAYVALFRGVLVGPDTDEVRRRLDVRVSYQITMAGLAATRIFSAAGAGGIILTYWALRKAGMPRRHSAARMVAFLVLTYSVYLSALIVFGVLLRTGVLPGDNPVGGTIIPAGIAAAVMLLFGLVALIPGNIERRIQGTSGTGRARRVAERIATVPATVSTGVRLALDFLSHPRRGALAVAGADRLLGGPDRHPLGGLRGLRRLDSVRRAGAGLLRGHGGQPHPLAGRGRGLGGRGHDRRVPALRGRRRDRVPRRAHLPRDRLLAADPARGDRLLPAVRTVHGWDRERGYTSQSKVTAEAT